jgi:FAD/FMN-containing dehydrogenase
MSAIEFAGLNGGSTRLTQVQLDVLQSGIQAPLLRAGDPGWDPATEIWNGMAASRPALVVQPASAHEVGHAVQFAREHGLLLGIKGGGHNIAGTSIAEGGLTLDMSRMRDVAVDPVARLARVGPGCRLADVDRATQEHGLATPLGFISETGVAGLTLGGGIGYLTRRFGWTVDNLEEVEIVTADGEIRLASRDQHSDLFWAIRGAGANFGVATRFTFRLHPVGPTVYGGLIAWPFERAEEVGRTYQEITRTGPRELSIWLILMRAPPAPFVPEELQGERACVMAVCYSGDLAGVDEAIGPIRALGDPAMDLLRPQPYVEIQSYLNDGEPKGMHYYWKTEFVKELSDELLAEVRELFARCPMPGAQIGFLQLGGALNERDPNDGAVGNRDARFAMGVNGSWAPGEPEEEAYVRWIQEAGARVRPFSTGGNYINFQTGDEGEGRVRATYGERYDRLVELKAKYDPGNLFRVNRNIVPGEVVDTALDVSSQPAR